MTNYEKLHELNPEELAWFLMNLDDCRCCAYKQLDEEGRFIYSADSCNTNSDKTCIKGYKEWLQKECTTKDDKLMFAVCRNNELVTMYNELLSEGKAYFELHRDENGLAVELVEL